MSFDKIEEHINLLLWGKRIVELNGQVYVFRSPTISEINHANFIHQSSLDRYRSEGVLHSGDELIKIAKSQGEWADVDNNYYFKFDELIKVAEDQLEGANTIQTKRIKKQIDRANKRREDVVDRYNRIVSYSFEHQAAEDRLRYLVKCVTEDKDGNAIWKDDYAFNNDMNHELLFRLMTAYVDHSHDIFKIDVLREIARSPMWRVRWGVGKNNICSLFGSNVCDLNELQIGLIYWSMVYDSVYMSMDCPSDSIIEDDEKLDKWLDDRRQEQERKKINRQVDRDSGVRGFYDRSGKFHHQGRRASDHQEYGQFVNGYFDESGVFRYYTPEEKEARIKEIQRGNAPDVKNILRSEQSHLKDKPYLREEQLRKGRSRLIMGSIKGKRHD